MFFCFIFYSECYHVSGGEVNGVATTAKAVINNAAAIHRAGFVILCLTSVSAKMTKNGSPEEDL